MKKLKVSPSVASRKEIESHLKSITGVAKCRVMTESKRFGYLTLRVSICDQKVQGDAWRSYEIPIPDFKEKEFLFKWIDKEVQKCKVAAT